MLSVLLALTACSPSGAIETESPESDTSEQVNSQAEPVADLSLWIGQRTFITDDCSSPQRKQGTNSPPITGTTTRRQKTPAPTAITSTT